MSHPAVGLSPVFSVFNLDSRTSTGQCGTESSSRREVLHMRNWLMSLCSRMTRSVRAWRDDRSGTSIFSSLRLATKVAPLHYPRDRRHWLPQWGLNRLRTRHWLRRRRHPTISAPLPGRQNHVFINAHPMGLKHLFLMGRPKSRTQEELVRDVPLVRRSG